MVVLGCTGLYWAALGCNKLYCQGGQDCPGGQGGPCGPGGPCDQVIQVIHVVQVVQVVQVVSLDDMHSENIWFSGSKPLNY